MTMNIDEPSVVISEIDVPPNETITSNAEDCKQKIVEQHIDKKDYESLEQKAKYADRMEKHIYKKHGLHLMIGCLIAYGTLVILDTLIPNFNIEMSKLSDGFVELLKFIVSTLIGFVFSESLKHDKDK